VAGWADYYSDYRISFPHSDSTLELLIYTSLNEHMANESFGFSHLKVVYCSEAAGDCKDTTTYTNV